MEKKGSLAEAPEIKEQMLRQLRTAEGHLSGIRKMIEQDRYCVDVLKQLAAVQGLLGRSARILAHAHAHGCIRTAIEQGRGAKAIDELFEALKYLGHL